MVCEHPPCWSDNEGGAEIPPPGRRALNEGQGLGAVMGLAKRKRKEAAMRWRIVSYLVLFFMVSGTTWFVLVWLLT